MPEMDDSSQINDPDAAVKGHFPATHWTQIVAINDPNHPQAEAQLNNLCKTYLGAIESYLRRRRNLPRDPRELANDFLSHFIQHDSLKRVDRNKGKFRHYLAQSLRNYLNNEYRQNKRRPESVEFNDEILSYEAEVDSDFDSPFAEAMIKNCLAGTRARFTGTRLEPFLDSLIPYMVAEPPEGVLQELARAHGVTRDLVYQNFRRFRVELRSQLRAEARKIIGPEDDVDQEIRELIKTYARRKTGV